MEIELDPTNEKETKSMLNSLKLALTAIDNEPNESKKLILQTQAYVFGTCIKKSETNIDKFSKIIQFINTLTDYEAEKITNIESINEKRKIIENLITDVDFSANAREFLSLTLSYDVDKQL